MEGAVHGHKGLVFLAIMQVTKCVTGFAVTHTAPGVAEAN